MNLAALFSSNAPRVRPCHAWKLPSRQLKLRTAVQLPSRICLSNTAARCAPPDVAATQQEACSISIPTADARRIRFELVPAGTGQAIVVAAVAEGSSAEQAGVTVGMRLTAISDPVRADEVWELQDRPSLRYVRDVVRMRAPAFIQMRFEPPAQDTLAALSAAAVASAAADGSLQLSSATTAANSGSSSSARTSSSLDSLESLSALSSMAEAGSGEQLTVAERLQQQYEQAQQAGKVLTAVQQREQRRKEYMEAAMQRDKSRDNSFLAIAAASFVLPALIILVIAYASGYLDNLYSNSLANFK